MSNRNANMQRPTSDSTADEAGYWDSRLRSPDCTDVDRASFAKWRDASPENREAFERLQSILAGLRHHMARADVRALRDSALNAQKRSTPARRLFAAAAAIAGLALATVFWAQLPDHFRRAPLSESVAMAQMLVGSQRATIYETGTGQRWTRTLQDGSSVELNAKTRIKVVFTRATRNVELLYGQALFHVAHDTGRPFVVRAADREITAVGTQFDVRLDSTSVRVTLIEGKVKVSRIYLTPGQQLVARLPGAHKKTDSNSEGNALVRTIDVAKVTGWRDGRIFLEDLTLTDAVAEMNRHSPVQITVADPQIAQLHVNGMFRAGEQEAFVTALEQYFPIAAEDRGDSEIILSLRKKTDNQAVPALR
jgi:transmembrane sensor